MQDIKKLKSLKSDQLNILVNIGYFDDFGTVPQINEWITSYDDLYGRSQFSKETVEEKYLSVITSHTSETEKQYREFDYLSAIKDYWALVPATKLGLKQRIKNEIEYFGYIQTIVPKLPKEYIVVTAKNDKYSKLTITGYVLKTGETQIYKIQPKIVEQCGDFNEGDILKLMDTKEEGKWRKNEQGDWIRSTTETEMLIKKYALTN